MASLWRAPVPWIHSHQKLEAQGLSEASLAWHLRHLHPQALKHAIAGWHIHLTCPWDISNEDPSPSQAPESPKPRAVYDMPYVVSQAPPAVDVDRHASGWLDSPPDVMQDATQPLLSNVTAAIAQRHFLQQYPPSVSLRALLCVVRC
jgi:hypothetical protein